MAKIITPGYFIGGRETAKNSLVATSESLVAIKSGVVDLAVAGDKIEGLSVETKTFDSDNETVKGAKLEFARLGDDTVVEIAVSGGTIAQANVGQKYNLTGAGVVNGAVITPVAQVDTVTLTGTSGTANVTGTGALTKLATFDTNLTTTASNFVTAHASAYASQGVTLTSSGVTLIFTATVAGASHTSPSVANVSGNLAGTNVATTANVAGASQLYLRKVITSTLGWFVRAK